MNINYILIEYDDNSNKMKKTDVTSKVYGCMNEAKIIKKKEFV